MLSSSSNSLGFSRVNRLLTQEDFQSVFASARKISRKYLIILYRPNLLLIPRIGFIISKRHVKQAVNRNLIRRIARESFRHHKEKLKGLDIIMLMRSECSALHDKKALRDDIDTLWPSIKF